MCQRCLELEEKLARAETELSLLRRHARLSESAATGIREITDILNAAINGVCPPKMPKKPALHLVKTDAETGK